MKLIIALFTMVSLSAWSAAPAPREISLKTAKVGEAVHWQPEKIEVKAGEKVKLIATHDLEGGFDFHGLFIPELKVSETVNRHKPTSVEVTVPKTLKPGEYKIGCQFHPKHVGATLVVKAGEPEKK